MTWMPGEEGQERSELAGAHLKQRSQAYGEAGRAVVFHLHPPSQLELTHKPEMRAEVSRPSVCCGLDANVPHNHTLEHLVPIWLVPL